METKFQTSFIPKQPVNEEVHKSSGSSVLFVIAFILFIASIAAAGGVFVYNKYLVQSMAKAQSDLQKNENAFDPNTIQELTRLNDRLTSIDILIKQHVAVSNLFSLLSAATLKTVRFNDFSFANVGGGKISLSMKGQATTYETVALQSRAFTDPSLKNAFKSSIFGDLNKDQSGNATFSFSAGLDPAVISYYKSAKKYAPDQPQVNPPQNTQTTPVNNAAQGIEQRSPTDTSTSTTQ